MNDRKFGIEIEAYGVSATMVASVLTAAGVNTVVEGYNHATREHWKIVSDASLRGLPDAFELVSPVLQGQAGLDAVAKAGEVLVLLGAKVNKACGLHVHVDARDLTVKQVGNVCKMFGKYENCFDQLVPASRRNNRFCDSILGGRTIEQLFAACDSSKTVAELRSNVNSFSRYRKLNLESLERHGTVEFRQHSGTVEAAKMVEWVKLVTGFVVEATSAKAIRMTGSGKMENLLSVTNSEGRKFFRNRAATLALAA